ncbi:FAD-binding oxidoreductase [Pseudotabrizicola alkalilacus]|uniref:FAD-binding oxidoreductase n=1 Tax=Pseudotabrizicola alkalilacus TaxID=2305252 RepID=A0A411Z4E3_9RHOB|nr:FAD-binding oxidoreductase [Pseudotabrizicola alkalilacus]RGP37948.1 FAD-binding oxidoreductase [Pseudotabrizicola alkalilacus]
MTDVRNMLPAADAALLDRLVRTLPPGTVLTGDAISPRYQEDRRDRCSAKPLFVLRPSSTVEMAAALAACHAYRQPVVVQGGRTGLSGAHRVLEGEAVLSLERFTALGQIDPDSATIEAQAGVPLQLVQEAASRAGLMFGVDIGSRGSATIGGNIATNAGGIRVMRYGMFRAQVAGLEAVLADGTVLTSMKHVEKDNTGPDLAQLFVGSEGVLGVVTRARLRLHPQPVVEANAFLALPSAEAALDLLRRLRKAMGGMLSAFEIMLPEAYHGVCGHLQITPPLCTKAQVYVLAEIQAGPLALTAQDVFETALMTAIEENCVLDAVVSQSRREFQALWDMRDGCADFVRTLPNVANGDISVPVGRVPSFLRESQAALLAIDPGTVFLGFGHLGDGNLHYVFQTTRKEPATEQLLAMVAAYGGSVSAEHGIGMDKKPWLHLSRSPAEIATMRALKTALDPRLILNRRRVFDLPEGLQGQ